MECVHITRKRHNHLWNGTDWGFSTINLHDKPNGRMGRWRLRHHNSIYFRHMERSGKSRNYLIQSALGLHGFIERGMDVWPTRNHNPLLRRKLVAPLFKLSAHFA